MSTRKPRAAAKVVKYIDDSDDEEFEDRISSRKDMMKSRALKITDEDEDEIGERELECKSLSSSTTKRIRTPEKATEVANENVPNQAKEQKIIRTPVNDDRKSGKKGRVQDSDSYESDSDVSSDDEEFDSETDSELEEPILKKKRKPSPSNSVKHKPSTPAAGLNGTKRPSPKMKVSPGKSRAASSSSSTFITSTLVENPVDITKGPPVNTENGAARLIKEYMKLQNRPYSAIQIFDNLHKRIQKSSVEKVLAKLSREEDKNTCQPVLCEKEYGKAKIYYYNQAQLPSLSISEMNSLDDEVATLNNELKRLESQVFEAKERMEKLLKEPTDDELDKELKETEARVETKRRKAETLSGPDAKSVDPYARQKVIEEYNFYRKHWKDRKEKVMDLIDMMSDGMNKKVEDVIEICGLESDENEGVKLPPPIDIRGKQ